MAALSIQAKKFYLTFVQGVGEWNPGHARRWGHEVEVANFDLVSKEARNYFAN